MMRSSCLVLLLVMAFGIFLTGCQSEERHVDPNARFKFVEELGFDGRKAHIVLDSKTKIKYLYIWDGGSNGGPAITRLWEK